MVILLPYVPCIEYGPTIRQVTCPRAKQIPKLIDLALVGTPQVELLGPNNCIVVVSYPCK